MGLRKILLRYYGGLGMENKRDKVNIIVKYVFSKFDRMGRKNDSRREIEKIS